MAALTLRLTDGTGAEHLYTSSPREEGGAGLLARELTVSEVVTATDVEMGDLTLSLAGPWMGAASRDDLPAPSVAPPRGRGQGAYRAVLERDGQVLLDGVVPLVGAAHDVRENAWTITLLAAAQADAWLRLEDVRLDALTEAAYSSVATRELDYLYRDTYTATGADRWMPSWLFPLLAQPRFASGFGSGRLVVYELRSLARAVLETAGLAVEGELPVPTLTAEYYTGPGLDSLARLEREATHHVWSLEGWKPNSPVRRTNPTLPAWTGAQLVEAVLATYGWRLAASYEPYPSQSVSVRLLADERPADAPDDLPALDARLATGGYTRRAEPASSDGFALRHVGRLSPSSEPSRLPDVVTDTSPGGADAVRPGLTAVAPPTVATLAQDRWTFEPTEPGRAASDPAPAAGQVTSTRWALPLVGPVPGEPGGAPFGLLRTTDARTVSGAPGYAESLVYGVPCLDSADRAAYIGVVVEGPAASSIGLGTGRLLYARLLSPTYGVPQRQLALVNEAWAGPLYELRGRSLAARELADGAWYLDGLGVQAGEAARGAALEGRAWIAAEIRRRLSDDRGALVLERPAGEPERPELPRGSGTVASLDASYQHLRIETDSGLPIRTNRIAATWTAPAPAAAADWYMVGLRRRAEPGQTPEPFAELRVFGTAHVWTLGSAQPYEPGTAWEIQVSAITRGARGAAQTTTVTVPD